MRKKKRPGYYWRLRKKIMRDTRQNQVIDLKQYPLKARDYIVCITFKDLPWGVKIIN